MSQLSSAQVGQILYQAGFRGQQIADMAAIAFRESSWRPAAHRTDQNPAALSGDRGLFQINYVHDARLIQAGIIKSRTDLFDPVTNARAAFWLFQQSGLAPWTAGPGGWTQGGDPFYGTDRRRGTEALNEAQRLGLLGTDFNGGGGGMSTAPATMPGASGSGTQPFNLPSDAKVYRHEHGMTAVFEPSPGVRIAYDIPWWTGQVRWNEAQVIPITGANFNALGTIRGGNALELATTVVTFGTFGAQWDAIINTVMGSNNPARHDPEVLRVIAEFAGRPDMTEAELQNRLQATQWYQTRTQGELEWNSLSEAERRTRLDETATRMIGTVFQFAGANVDRNDPRVANYVEDVASGKIGFGAWTEIIKQGALENTESPWSRQVRTEDENQRQRPIDIENTAQRIREESERWGVGWSADTIAQWARDMVEKRRSDEDLNKALREQAMVLFPWKNPEMDTTAAAAPWLETYRRVMEAPASLSTPEVMRALQAGRPAFDFEVELKKSDKWLQTRNGQDSMFSAVGELGRRMGFE
jgi:hypothetical protein